jgi:acyl dehydratase
MTAVGEVHTSVLVDGLSRTQIVQYAGASGDFNPLHTDEIYARDAGQPGVFAHGMLTMAMAARLLSDQYPLEAVARFGGRFISQVWPGDTLIGTTTVTSLNDDGTMSLRVEVSNQNQAPVFIGEAVVGLERDL